MIDVEVMAGRIRSANPIPSVDGLDADELAAFVSQFEQIEPGGDVEFDEVELLETAGRALTGR